MTPDTNKVQKPKHGCERPKKYFTDENKKKADKRDVKKCMGNNSSHCDLCDRIYHMASKSRHLRSKKHIRNFEKKNL